MKKLSTYFATWFHCHLDVRLGQCSWLLTKHVTTTSTTFITLCNNNITFIVFWQPKAGLRYFLDTIYLKNPVG